MTNHWTDTDRRREKLEFHGTDTDTDTDILADFRARIVARMSVIYCSLRYSTVKYFI